MKVFYCAKLTSHARWFRCEADEARGAGNEMLFFKDGTVVKRLPLRQIVKTWKEDERGNII